MKKYIILISILVFFAKSYSTFNYHVLVDRCNQDTSAGTQNMDSNSVREILSLKCANLYIDAYKDVSNIVSDTSKDVNEKISAIQGLINQNAGWRKELYQYLLCDLVNQLIFQFDMILSKVTLNENSVKLLDSCKILESNKPMIPQAPHGLGPVMYKQQQVELEQGQESNPNIVSQVEHDISNIF